MSSHGEQDVVSVDYWFWLTVIVAKDTISHFIRLCEYDHSLEKIQSTIPYLIIVIIMMMLYFEMVALHYIV